jgi:hypothetical protein
MNKLVFFAIVSLLTMAASAETLGDLKQNYSTALLAASEATAGFEAHWQAARTARFYGAAVVADHSPGWQDLARQISKEGLQQAEMATALEPGRVEGWYWYCRCIQTYTECISLLSAFFEGLQGKSQTALENAYRIDKMYDEGLPILSLGRYWMVLPGIAGQDLGKAERLLNEYIATMSPLGKVAAEGWLFRGELYREKRQLGLARADFTKAANQGNADAVKALKELK